LQNQKYGIIRKIRRKLLDEFGDDIDHYIGGVSEAGTHVRSLRLQPFFSTTTLTKHLRRLNWETLFL
jgi:hypothetical protein